MKGRLSLALAALIGLAGCAAPGATTPALQSPAAAALAKAPAGGKAVAIPVANGGFENDGGEGRAQECPPNWWCTMHSDPASFRFSSVPGGPSGRFLRGERLKPEPWALVTQSVPAKGLEGRVLRVTSDVGTAGLKSGTGAGPVIRVYGPGGRVIAAEQALRARGEAWGRAAVELAVPKGAEIIDVGVVMYGDGIADFDNVAAEHFAR